MPLLQIVLLSIGTVAAVFFLVLMAKGKRYDALIEGLPDEGYSDKELFAVGFALQEIPVFSMKSGIGKKLMADANILYPENNGRFAEFWARLYWARTLSLSMMVVAFVFCIASWMQGASALLIAVFAVLGAVAFYDAGANEMEKRIKKRSDACVQEFSNVVSKLAMLMNCGLIMKDAWFIVAYSKEGEIYDLMREACNAMNSGESAAEAVYNFGVRSSAQEIRKFSSILIQNIEKGGSDVTMYMRQQSQELWAHRRQLMLQKGDEAAAKLLLPTMLVLVGLIIMIVSAALSGLSLGF